MATDPLGRQTYKGTSGWYDRFGAIPNLVVTSAVAFTLLALNISGWRGSESLLNWTRTNKTITTIFVQVASHILGLMMVQVVCALLRTSFVFSMSKRPFSLRMAQFVQAASTPRMTLTLPWKLSLPLICLVLASFVPGALWAGALVPYATERNATQVFQIPNFDITNSSQIWNGNTKLASRVDGAGQNWVTDLGLFSFERASMRGPLQASASDASFITDNFHRHAKLDKTGYAYINRSYGAGGIAGFVNFTDVNSTNWFSYTEQGLGSSVKCFYNRSTALYFQSAVTKPINVFQSFGEHADGSQAPLTNYMAYTSFSLFSWGVSYNKMTRKVQAQIITDVSTPSAQDNYDFYQFNNVQCDASLSLQEYDVFVNSTSKLIYVTPKPDKTLPWPNWGDAVANKLQDFLWGLTEGDGCVDGCTLGTSMLLNVNKMRAQRGDRTNSTDITLEAVQDYVTALIDDSLVDLLLTRMVSHAPNATKQATVTIGVPAVTFGDIKLIIIVAVVDVLICIAYVIELIRTRAWIGIPKLDFMNLAEILISASRGGMVYEKEAGRTGEKSSFDDGTRMRLQRGTDKAELPLLVPLLDEHSDSRRLLDQTYQQVPKSMPDDDDPFDDGDGVEMSRRPSYSGGEA